jgi:hypothetical protein
MITGRARQVKADGCVYWGACEIVRIIHDAVWGVMYLVRFPYSKVIYVKPFANVLLNDPPGQKYAKKHA